MGLPSLPDIGELNRAEHIGPAMTGDNIDAKKVAGYQWNGGGWNRSISGLFTKAFDELVIVYTDTTKTVISTITTKLSGVTQETITNDGDSVTDDFVRS